MRILTVILAVAALACVAQAQAPIFSVDCQSATALTQPGMEAFSFATTTTSVNFVTASGHTLTLTPSGTGPATAVNMSVTDKKTDPDYTDGAPREYALQDYMRVQPSPYANPLDIVTLSVEIATVTPNTLYGIRIGNMSPYRNVYTVISPTLGTTGSVVNWVSTNPPALSATDTNDKSYVLSYTSDSAGELHFDMTWDKAAWELSPLYPTYPENEVQIGYIQLLPEPATLSLLALGGLMAIRRRR